MRRFSDDHVNAIARRARAMGDPTRVRILDVLARAEQPVGQVASALTTEPSTISKHLQVLFHAGLVKRRREASAVIYTIADDDLLEWCRYLSAPQLGPRPQRV